MDKEGKWLLMTAAIGFVAVIIGSVIGGYCTLQGSYWYWSQQQKAAEQQQKIEQHNIAQALYFDVWDIEDKLNDSMGLILDNTTNNLGELDDPNFIFGTNIQYPSTNWIYSIFGKDISRFDSSTSGHLFSFYNSIYIINDMGQFAFSVSKKRMDGEQISQSDLIIAHTYTTNLFKNRIPISILQAEIIKQELRQKYHITPYRKIIIDSPSKTINLENNHSRVIVS